MKRYDFAPGIDEGLRRALYEEAKTNGLSAHEYRILCGEVDDLIDKKVRVSMESVHGIVANDYDIGGMPV